MGACMVSSEGSCAAYWAYGRFRDRETASTGGRAMNKYEPLGRKLDLRYGRVDLSHGSGGRAMARLIADVFHKAFDNDFLRAGNDQSAFDIAGGRMVMTTDGYVVSPLFFPGGDIGSLAVNGTINDIAMAGAKPLYMSASFIIEEGFPLADLARIAQSMGDASRAAGVPIITGDTKVVERGKADGVFISTACVGVVPARASIFPATGRGPATHFAFGLDRRSRRRRHVEARKSAIRDAKCCPTPPRCMIWSRSWSRRRGASIRADARSRRAAAWRRRSTKSRISPGVGVRIEEAAVPVRPQVAAACELLGLDPLYRRQ